MNDHDHVNRFPLEWPMGWRRKPTYARVTAPFRMIVYRSGSNGQYKDAAPLTHEGALNRLDAELDRLGATDITLSSNVELRLDGRPRGDQKPTDPGVAVYFRFKKRPTVLACDSYTTVSGNIAAIAAHIEALRRIERHGVGTIEQAMAGYKSLPADTAADWRMVLGLGKDALPTIDQVKDAHRELAREHHPDKGGSDDKMMQLNRARDYALEELKG